MADPDAALQATLRSCYLPGATENHGGLFAGSARDHASINAALTHPRARTSHLTPGPGPAYDMDAAFMSL